MISRGILPLIVVLWSAAACLAASPAELSAEGKFDEAVAAYQKAIEAAADNREKGMLYKQLGDLYVTKDDYGKAADQFIPALAHYGGFSEKERLQMAIYIAWADRLKEAITAVRAILAINPDNTDARVNLARFLSWANELTPAIEEADRVLEASPDNRDVLLVKANALSWRGDYDLAIPIYRDLLNKGDNFDARLGLANALLASGQRAEAEQAAMPLQPAYSYQERELGKFRTALGKTTLHDIDLRYSYYRDTDHNYYNRVTASYTYNPGTWRAGASYRRTYAWEHIPSGRAEEFAANFYAQAIKFLGVGGSVGLTQTSSWNGDHLHVTGQVKADATVLKGTAGASFSREAFTETAQLIQNGITYTNASVYFSQKLVDSLTLSGSYSYRAYSDSNHANDVQLSPRYTLYAGNPTITAGARLRYLNFDHQTAHGYFDPNYFQSYGIFVSAYGEWGNFYGYLEPNGGYQTFRRKNIAQIASNTDDLYGGVNGSMGYRITKNVLFEAEGEFGNYALGTTSGFEYYVIGARIGLTF